MNNINARIDLFFIFAFEFSLHLKTDHQFPLQELKNPFKIST